MEVIHGGELLLDGVAIGVDGILRGDVSCHDFFAEDVAIALNLAAFAGVAVAAVEHSGIGFVVADGPNHPLKDERGESLLALHKGKDEVLVIGIERTHIAHHLKRLVEGIGEQSVAVLSSLTNLFLHHLDAGTLETGVQ